MLTQLQIINSKPAEKPYKLSDGKGLHLLVQPQGSKLWRFRYRFQGRENMLALGALPSTTLAQARDKRDDARKLLAQGVEGKKAATPKKAKAAKTEEPKAE